MRLLKFELLLLCLLASCGEQKQKTSKQLSVNIDVVSIDEIDQKKEFTFISKPYMSSELSFRVGGPIDKFDIIVGNHYKKGDLIARIDPRDFVIRKERAEGVYKQAKSEYERVKVLFEKDNVSASSFDKAYADFISAKTAYEFAVNELNDTELVAPFDGYVSELYIDKFDQVKATQPIVSFVEIDRLKIEVFVPQDVAFNADKLKTVNLYFDGMRDSIFTAQVVEISKSTTKNNISYLLTAVLNNSNQKLISGMSGKVFFAGSAGKKDDVVVVPQSAVCHRPQEGDFVWVVSSDGVVTKRNVILGELQKEGMVVVRSGLEAGETVAVSGLRFLSNNMEVTVNK